jgi:putative transposase
MPRKPRNSLGGVVYHVLNRGNGRRRVFFTPADYLAFLVALADAASAVPGVRILAWCVMPNHWHLVLWPRRDGELSAFVRRLTQAHAQRHRVAHDRVGYGSLYQGRYRSFPVQPDDANFLTLCRYVERNALRARLCRRAADWRWGSAWARLRGDDDLRALLSDWPVDRPRNWDQILNEPQPGEQEDRVQASITRGSPLGDGKWARRAADRMGLQHTLRPIGRPPGPAERGDGSPERLPQAAPAGAGRRRR